MLIQIFDDWEEFKIKEKRTYEEALLCKGFKDIIVEDVLNAFKQVTALKGDQESFEKWKRKFFEKEWQLKYERREMQCSKQLMKKSC